MSRSCWNSSQEWRLLQQLINAHVFEMRCLTITHLCNVSISTYFVWVSAYFWTCNEPVPPPPVLRHFLCSALTVGVCVAWDGSHTENVPLGAYALWDVRALWVNCLRTERLKIAHSTEVRLHRLEKRSVCLHFSWCAHHVSAETVLRPSLCTCLYFSACLECCHASWFFRFASVQSHL